MMIQNYAVSYFLQKFPIFFVISLLLVLPQAATSQTVGTLEKREESPSLNYNPNARIYNSPKASHKKQVEKKPPSTGAGGKYYEDIYAAPPRKVLKKTAPKSPPSKFVTPENVPKFLTEPVLATGLYIGEQTGYTLGDSSQELEHVDGSTQIFYKRDLSLRGLSIGGFIGYGVSISRLYFGGEYALNYYGAKVTSASGNYRVNSVALQPASLKQELLYGHITSLRGGIYLNLTTLLYLRAGHALTFFRNNGGDFYSSLGYTNPTDLRYQKTFTKSVHGIVFGFGMESALSENLALRFDFYNIYNPSFKGPTYDFSHGSLGNDTNYMKFQNSYLHAGLGISYRLGYEKALLPPVEDSKIPQGVYLGVQGGIDTLNVPTKGITRYGGPTKTDYMSNPLKSPSYGGFAGVSLRRGRLFGAIESAHYINKAKIDIQSVKHINLPSNQWPTINFKDYFSARHRTILRAGLLMNASTILYAAGGHAKSTFHHSYTMIGPTLENARFDQILIPYLKNFKKRLSGYVVGGGIEAFIWKGLSIRAEFLHEKYRTFTMALPGFTPDQAPTSVTYHPEVNSVHLGISYTF